MVSKDGIFDSIKQRRGVIDCRIESNSGALSCQCSDYMYDYRAFTLFTLHHHTCACIYTVYRIVLGKHPWVLAPPSTNVEGGHEGGALMAAQK